MHYIIIHIISHYHVASLDKISHCVDFLRARETWIAHDTLLGKLRQHVFWLVLFTNLSESFILLSAWDSPRNSREVLFHIFLNFLRPVRRYSFLLPRQFFSPNLRRFPWCHHRAKPKQLREYRHSSTWDHLSHGFFDICGVPSGGTFLSWKLRNYQLISNIQCSVLSEYILTNLNLGGIWGHQAIQWLGGFLQRGCHWHACYILPGLWIQLCWWVAQATWRQEVVQWLENETLQQIDRTNLHFTQFLAEELLYLNRSKMIKDDQRWSKTCAGKLAAYKHNILAAM